MPLTALDSASNATDLFTRFEGLVFHPLMIPFDVAMLGEAGHGLFQYSFAQKNHSVLGF